MYSLRHVLRGTSTPRFWPLRCILAPDWVLYYNTNSGNKAWNGNIMYQYWGVSGNLTNNYTYKYDKLNRLTSGITSADNYQESSIAYDTQGNLTFLNRYQAGNEIDQLQYYYSGKNSLDSVKDNNASNSGLVSGITRYTYDGNGNMLTAANTANTGQNKSFTYNILNLPNVVTVPNGTDTYTYDAEGNKLRRVSVIGGVTKTTDYIGGIEYDNSSTAIGFIQTEEGKAVPNGTTNYDYNYYLGDNLGNTRVTFGAKTAAAIVYQQDDYYPFGLEILRTSPTPNPKNEYLYNKKELQEDFTEYDYGARFYDPVIARWTSVDPKADSNRRWSPYRYGYDNPLRFVDPDGMEEKPGDLFKTIADAAEDFGKYYNGSSIQTNREYNSAIYAVQTESGTMYTYTPSDPQYEASSSAAIPPPDANGNPGTVGIVHSHGDYELKTDDQFSPQDIQHAKDLNVPAFVATPNGSLLNYDPKTNKTTTASTDLPSSSKDPTRKNDISPYTGNSEQKDQQNIMKPQVAKQDAIPKLPMPPPILPKKKT